MTEAEDRARQRFDDRMARLEGHKVATWETLSDLMREQLIYYETITCRREALRLH
jgi:hypothetical protein